MISHPDRPCRKCGGLLRKPHALRLYCAGCAVIVTREQTKNRKREKATMRVPRRPPRTARAGRAGA
jgi:hypothetical protein